MKLFFSRCVIVITFLSVSPVRCSDDEQHKADMAGIEECFTLTAEDQKEKESLIASINGASVRERERTLQQMEILQTERTIKRIGALVCNNQRITDVVYTRFSPECYDKIFNVTVSKLLRNPVPPYSGVMAWLLKQKCARPVVNKHREYEKNNCFQEPTLLLQLLYYINYERVREEHTKTINSIVHNIIPLCTPETINYSGRHNQSALFYALRFTRNEALRKSIVEALLAQGADVRKTTVAGITPYAEWHYNQGYEDVPDNTTTRAITPLQCAQGMTPYTGDDAIERDQASQPELVALLQEAHTQQWYKQEGEHIVAAASQHTPSVLAQLIALYAQPELQ